MNRKTGSNVAVAFTLGALIIFCGMLPLAAQEAEPGYRVQPGDYLRISVWKEEDLQQDLLVLPDGGISFPLAGALIAVGHSTSEIRDELVTRIEEFIPEPVVTVQVLAIEGNKIYVLGKVNRPGEFVMTRMLDVTQALAIAGGLAVFADENKISILRRTNGSQKAIPFRYGDVQHGRNLEQNILLQPGDIVVVP